jgi:hypothetical protein
VPFFQRICDGLVGNPIDATFEEILVALLTALRELLQREPRINTNDELSALIESLADLVDGSLTDKKSAIFYLADNRVKGLRAILARARGLHTE